MDLCRLWDGAELIVREDDAIPVVVFDVAEDPRPVLDREILLAGIENAGVGIGFAERVGNVEDVGLESDDHRLVRQPEALHLIGRRTHDDRLAAPHLVIADPAAVGFKHPHGVLLARIEVGKA